MTHCKRGHAYTEANTYLSRTSGRQCRACRKLARQHRPAIRSVERIELDEAAKRRLRDAAADGVSLDDLAGRFSVDSKTVRRIISGAA